MKYKWLNRGENNKIILFFNGWGMDENVVKHLDCEDYDVLMFYDYNTLETDLFNKLFEQYELYQDGEPFKVSYKGSKKYPVAKYIYRRMNGVFDYLGLDEAHLLMNNSLQGVASHHLMKAAKHTLLLTGTLLNGFAANLFYTLFRIHSS